MKTKLKLFQARMFCAVTLGIGSSFGLTATAADSAATAPAKSSIPWAQIGAKAGADYRGDGLAVSPNAGGARLRCVFQRLAGEATREGLWLTSTVIPPSGTVNDRFRVVAADVRRLTSTRKLKAETVNEFQSLLTSAATRHGGLPPTGAVSIDGQTVRFTRPGLTEEYTVSMDGLRQDFIIEQRAVGTGPLRLELDVAGARVEPSAGGAQLVLVPRGGTGRKIAYSRLRVTDATGRELTAHMEVSDGRDAFHRVPIVPGGDQGRGGTHPYLVVVVNDAEAVYPVRIDPTFSDANWSSMGGFLGADGAVNAAVVDGSGNLYIGGQFTVVGDVFATNIAKWNGSSWTALGSGVNGGVSALAVSGSDLYAGGAFTMAGDSAANYIAKWNGRSWSALGSGMGGDLNGYGVGVSVSALAVSGGDLYAGGVFTNAGGSAANYVAKWDGNSWSALGSGMDDYVSALAVSGSDLYAGGFFSTAGGTAANSIAKWNGSSWTALGSGMGGAPPGYVPSVSALAVTGSDLYAGGFFSTAGGSAASSIAKWKGSSWTALGSGMGGAFPYVYALAVSGSDVYAGGGFTTAGGSAANNIAKWNGSSWSARGSGMNDQVSALAVSGSDLYAGGGFTTAGGSAANFIAKWDGSSWSALGSGMG